MEVGSGGDTTIIRASSSASELVGGSSVASTTTLGRCALSFSVLGSVGSKIEVSLRNLLMPDSPSGGGTTPLSASVSCFAACITASWGVIVGDVMYLCLKNIVSAPCTAFVLVQ